jgi:hypothetical protein
MITDRHLYFLDDIGASKVRHSGATLLTHLVGTHELLRQWGCPDHVCLAGLFHSIYGTNVFEHKLMDRDRYSRERLWDLIGSHAEELVYLFATSDRPRAWFDGSLDDSVGTPTLRKLREIEAANLLEQSSMSRWLGNLMGCDINENAKLAIAEHIKRDGIKQEQSHGLRRPANARAEA